MSEIPKKAWPDSIDEKLKKLRKLDQISVFWIDASQCSNVPINGNEEKIANHAIETIVISEGKFLAIQSGESYDDPHLLLIKDTTDQKKATIQSIPLVLVHEITIFDKVQLISRASRPTEIRYQDGIIKRIHSF